MKEVFCVLAKDQDSKYEYKTTRAWNGFKTCAAGHEGRLVFVSVSFGTWRDTTFLRHGVERHYVA